MKILTVQNDTEYAAALQNAQQLAEALRAQLQTLDDAALIPRYTINYEAHQLPYETLTETLLEILSVSYCSDGLSDALGVDVLSVLSARR